MEASPAAVKAEIAKLEFLRAMDAHSLDLSVLPAERRRFLATVGRRLTAQALQRRDPERRYPILLTLVGQSATEVLDEVVQLFDQAVSARESKAERTMRGALAERAKAGEDRQALLDAILAVVADPAVPDEEVGGLIRGERIGWERLRAAQSAALPPLPRDHGHLAALDGSYGYLRQFTPQVLEAVPFAGGTAADLLAAVEILRDLNVTGARKVPAGAPAGFVPARWRGYLDRAADSGDASAYRHYWELCVLLALRDGLRSGDVWVPGSRRYCDPAAYLLTPAKWAGQRAEFCRLVGKPADPATGLAQVEDELHTALGELEQTLAAGDGPVRLNDDGDLVVSPLSAVSFRNVTRCAVAGRRTSSGGHGASARGEERRMVQRQERDGELARWVEHQRGTHAAWMAALPPAAVRHVAEVMVGGRPARLYVPGETGENAGQGGGRGDGGDDGGRPPVLVYLHGGGWVMGDIDCYDGVARALAVATGAAVVSLEYRQPPEHPHPAALADTVAALGWIAEHGDGLGLDTARIGVAGDSAGGQLAAAAALCLNGAGTPPAARGVRLAVQVLIYPALDLRDQPSYPDLLTRMLALYLGGQDRTTAQVSPLLAVDLTGLPAAVIAVAEHDVLREQGERYAARLRDAGVPATLLPSTGLQHGFLGQLGTVPAADAFMTRIGRQAAALLHNASPSDRPH